MKMLNRIYKSSIKQIQAIKESMNNLSDSHQAVDVLTNHIRDLKLIHGTALATSLFLITRLMLGLFGMDLYEIYWWFALGLTTALYNIDTVARKKTEILANGDKTQIARAI